MWYERQHEELFQDINSGQSPEVVVKPTLCWTWSISCIAVTDIVPNYEHYHKTFLCSLIRCIAELLLIQWMVELLNTDQMPVWYYNKSICTYSSWHSQTIWIFVHIHHDIHKLSSSPLLLLRYACFLEFVWVEVYFFIKNMEFSMYTLLTFFVPRISTTIWAAAFSLSSCTVSDFWALLVLDKF